MTYIRGRQHLNGCHQKATYKKMLILILRLTQSNQWVGVGHTVRIQSLNSSHMTLVLLIKIK